MIQLETKGLNEADTSYFPPIPMQHDRPLVLHQAAPPAGLGCRSFLDYDRYLEEGLMWCSVYTDRRSRSEPAYVDPSLRRRMSCFSTPIA